MPTVAEAFRTAVAHHEAGQLAEAEALYTRILAVAPDHAGCLHRLGGLALETGRHDLAIALIGRAMAIDDREPVYPNTLGNVLYAQGRLDEAAAQYRRALALKPDYAGALYNLGNVLQAQGRAAAALAAFEQVLALKPDHAETLNNLAAVLLDLGRPDEAVARAGQALALQPGLAEALNTQGRGLQELGRLDEAVARYRQAIRLRPDYAEAHSNLLMTLNYLPDLPAAGLAGEHARFGDRFQRGLPARPLPANLREPERRLRVGYVSGDFRDHVVGHFVEPLFAAHDRSRIAVHGYSETLRPDAVTRRLRGLAEGWRDTAGLDPETLAGQIRADGIDILVDLAGHSAFNRLPVFARRPAPVQVTWLGYPATTGLSAIDYRLVDAVTDPPGAADRLASETLVRLGPGFLCYRPPPAPEPGPPPLDRNGFVTFGSFNNLNKVNDRVIALWAALLHREATARLLLKSRQLACGSVREALRRAFAGHGIGDGRLELLGWTPAASGHLETYRRIDLALDPFPYNGTTTTCEALWMGVPVVTLAGDRHAARVGASLLGQLGLDGLVAGDAAGYVAIAASLAGDPERLAGLRATLRDRMRAAPLCDAPGFARRIEAAYREMWRRWCRDGSGDGPGDGPGAGPATAPDRGQPGNRPVTSPWSGAAPFAMGPPRSPSA
jgi:predicted O-linked N-acetylglucosamine transferase (SPINDLY family)